LKTLHWSVMTKMFRFGGDLGLEIGLESEIFCDSIVIGSCLLVGYGDSLRLYIASNDQLSGDFGHFERFFVVSFILGFPNFHLLLALPMMDYFH
jgi:hypothetical protein